MVLHHLAVGTLGVWLCPSHYPGGLRTHRLDWTLTGRTKKTAIPSRLLFYTLHFKFLIIATPKRVERLTLGLGFLFLWVTGLDLYLLT